MPTSAKEIFHCNFVSVSKIWGISRKIKVSLLNVPMVNKNSGTWEIWIWSFWPWWRSGLWLAAIYSCIHTYYTSFLYTDLEVWCHRSQAELQNRSKKGIGVWLHSTRLTRFKICQDESGGWQIKSSTTSRLLLIHYKNNISTQGLDLCFKVIIAIKSSKHS